MGVSVHRESTFVAQPTADSTAIYYKSTRVRVLATGCFIWGREGAAVVVLIKTGKRASRKKGYQKENSDTFREKHDFVVNLRMLGLTTVSEVISFRPRCRLCREL